MKRLPQSFVIFKEELNRVKLEKQKLKDEYEKQIRAMQEELDYLKEQLQSQHQMLENSIDYANRLENQVTKFKGKIESYQARLKQSMH